MANNVNISINAIDNASKNIKNVQSSFSKLNRGFQDLTGFSLGAAGGLALAGKGISEVGKFIKSSLTETISYNKTIREMAQVTGLGAEEISRIVQVGDDWGISIEAIRTSLAFMNKSGLTPSIDNLAKLADEYVAATDKSAWAEKAVKVLGRGYQTLVPLLAQGGDSLREQTKSIADNLVATDKSIEMSRRYEVAMDNLGDSVQGLKYTLGNELLPTVVEYTEALGKNIAKLFTDQDAIDQLNAAEKAGLITRKDIIRIMQSVAKGTMTYADALKWLISLTKTDTSTEDDRIDAIRGARFATRELTGATDGQIESVKKLIDPLEKVNQAYDDLNMAINGRLGPTMEDYVDTQSDLQEEMHGVQDEIDKAINQGYSPLGEKVIGLKGDYAKLSEQYGTNAIEHDKATKEILFDILEQRLAVGGLTADEEELLERQAKAWGLVDQATLDVMTRYDEAGKYLETHKGDWINAEKIINGQETAWSLAKGQAIKAGQAIIAYGNELAKIDGKTVRTTIITMHQEGSRTGHQRGGGFVIPPGYPNDSYPLGAGHYGESGEIVTVTPTKYITNNFNYSSHTNAQSSTLMRDFNMMKAIAG